MAIEVSSILTDLRCESKVTTHGDSPPLASFKLTIGSQPPTRLCLDCARKTFNALGAVIMSATGESVEHLVGIKRGRRG